MADDLQPLRFAGIGPEQDDLTGNLTGTGIQTPAVPSLRRLAPPTPASISTPTSVAPDTPNPVDPAMSKWDEVKQALREATSRGAVDWITGKGNPKRILNPFLGLRGLGPAFVYSPERYAGVGAMLQRLGLMRDENSPPMVSLRTATLQNPLMEDATIKVSDNPSLRMAGRRVGGYVSWADPLRPEITLVPIVGPTTDPGLVATHEIVGHVSHGPVRAQSTDDLEKNIVPKVEGLATGVEQGVYGELMPPTPYDRQYGTLESYQRSRALGEDLARYIRETGKVPPWTVVQRVLFGRSPSARPAKPETPTTETQGDQGTPTPQPRLSSPSSGLRALGLRPKPDLDKIQEDYFQELYDSLQGP